MSRVVLLHDIQAGGVSAYYRKLENKFIHTPHFIPVGARPGERGLFWMILRLAKDYVQLYRLLAKDDLAVVHVNPSLDLKAFLRDGLFVRMSAKQGKKVLVFFRGWQWTFAKRIDRWLKPLFSFLYGRAACFVVLSSQFKQQLTKWGVKQPIYVEVTVMDESMADGFDLEGAIDRRIANKPPVVLFLSRLIREKGILKLICAMAVLKRMDVQAKLIVAGTGKALSEARRLVQELVLSNVEFVGHIEGLEKRRLLESANIFCLPSYHGEGFPNAVVEAMAFGLPVVSRPVGALPEFFKDGINGYLVSSLEPEAIAAAIEHLLKDPDLCKRISRNNYQYAREHFLAKDAARRLESIWQMLELGHSG